MLGQLVIYLFYVLIVSSIALGLLNWLRANIADLRISRLRREQLRHPSARHRRRRLLLSVIVYAHNDAALINDCLQNIVASSYRHLEIIIIDNASTDATKQLIREFIAAHPRQQLRLVAKRRTTNRPEAVTAARRYIKGELVAVLNAGSLIEPGALRSASALLAEPHIDVVLANTRIAVNYRLLGIARRFQALATIWYKKGGGYITPGLDNYNHVAVYSHAVFTDLIRPARRKTLDSINLLRQQSANIAYDSGCVVDIYQRPAGKTPMLHERNFGQRLIHSVQNGLIIIEPLIICFMMYVAARFGQAGYLLLAWVSFSSLLLLAIWSDDSRSFWTKLGQTMLVPVTYSLYILQRLNDLALIIKPTRHKLPGRLAPL